MDPYIWFLTPQTAIEPLLWHALLAWTSNRQDPHLIAFLTFFPIRAMQAWRHPPSGTPSASTVLLPADCGATMSQRLCTENLLGYVTLGKCWQWLVKVIAGAPVHVTQPFVPFANGIHRHRTVCCAAAAVEAPTGLQVPASVRMPHSSIGIPFGSPFEPAPPLKAMHPSSANQGRARAYHSPYGHRSPFHRFLWHRLKRTRRYLHRRTNSRAHQVISYFALKACRSSRSNQSLRNQ